MIEQVPPKATLPVPTTTPIVSAPPNLEPTQAMTLQAQDLAIQREMADAAEMMVYLTAGQIVLGVIGAAILVFSLVYTRRALTLTHQALKDEQVARRLALIETGNQTRATNQSIRAYIDVNTQSMVDCIVSERPRGCIQILNCGQTPAHNVTMTAITRWVGPNDPAPSYDELPVVTDRMGVLIGPQQQMLDYKSMEMELTQSEHDDLSEGRRRIAFFGRIDYTDVLGESHYFRFCRAYHGPHGSDWRAAFLPNESD